MKQVLSALQASERIAESLPAWRADSNELVRVYETGSWRVTMLLAGLIAYLAEAANHHPDLLLSYARVTVRLSSHDVGGITERDLDLARRIEHAAVGDRPNPDIHIHAPREWVR